MPGRRASALSAGYGGEVIGNGHRCHQPCRDAAGVADGIPTGHRPRGSDNEAQHLPECFAAVALAHGLHASRIDGSPLIYNQQDTYMPDLLICRPEWSERVLAEVSKLSD